MHRSSLAVFFLLFFYQRAFAARIPSSEGCKSKISAAYINDTIKNMFTAIPEWKIESLHKEIEQKTGCQLELLDYPVARIQHKFVQGHLGMVLARIKNPEMDRYGTFYPLRELSYFLITRKDIPAFTRIDEVIQAKNVKFGYIRGTVMPTVLIESLSKENRLDESRDLKMLIEKLQGNRNQATMMVNPYVLIGRKETELLREFANIKEIKDPEKASAGIYISNSAISNAEREIILSGLKKLSDEKTIDKYFDKRLQE